MSTLDQYWAVVEGAAAPLKERLHEIENDLIALREEKAEIESILRKTNQLPQKNGKPKTQRPTVAAETLDRFASKLHESFAVGELFWAGMVADDPRFDFISRATVQKALVDLHSRGDIRLHSTGQGGRKNYMVVE